MELLEHHLAHLLSIRSWVSRCLSEHGECLAGVNSKFVIIQIFPDAPYIIPVLYNTIFGWVTNIQNTSELISLFSYMKSLILGVIDRIISNPNSANDSWEFDRWCIAISILESSFNHTYRNYSRVMVKSILRKEWKSVTYLIHYQE